MEPQHLLGCRKNRGMVLTVGLSVGRSRALAHSTLLLQIQIPAVLLSLRVLEVERDNGLGLVDGVFALGRVTLEGGVDHVEGGGGRESV